MKFDILDRFTGEVKFTADIECSDDESTSIKLRLAVAFAIKNKIDLRYADLRYANLRYADLRSADLRYANLRSANLRYADLRSANLRYADLRYANLRSADLSYADLRYADLRILQTDIWTCYIQKEHIRIGCKFFTVSEWGNFTDNEISKMDSNALIWWKTWKPIVLNIADTLK